MILFFLVILVVFGVAGFILLDKYPSFLLNGIFEKCQKEQFSFLEKSFIFLNPTNINNQVSVAKYFEKLKKYLTETKDGLNSSFRFETQAIKSKQDEHPRCKVIVKLKFSLGGADHIEKVEFNFIRYNWWKWTLFDCKESNADFFRTGYHSINNK